ncbi:cupincin-like [Triticum dicoccoides]|uniref:cupincin-like n=1 Tax=Triticum dicoccoides TaxID=85692 RepID=UPI00188F0428|nr:cupincin-like [Triticum dicoccoides]
MKPSVRSPWLVLALVLSLCLSLSFASWDAEDVGRGGRRWKEGGDDEGRSGSGSGSGSGRPYHFGEESFREWAKSRHGHFKVLERFDHELLRGSIGDYRVACLDAAPRAFLQPSHYDADEIAFVREGEGVLVLLRNGKRESFCVREGDVFVIPAGSIVYSANTHRSKWFRVVMLLNPVSTPGSFQEFSPIGFGGEQPQSFFSVFSDEVIQAAFNTRRREDVDRVFETKSRGEGQISEGSEEQIRELSRSCSRGGRGGGGGSGSEKEEIQPRSLTGEKPRYSNKHGRVHQITGDQCHHLRKLDMDVTLVNITRGSMTALRYATRSTRIYIVVEGRDGYFEIACPHVSSSSRSERREHEQEREREHGHGRRSEEREREHGQGRRSEEREHEQGRQEEEQGHGGEQEKSRGYKQVRAEIKVGSVIVLPAGHPATFVAGNEGNLALLSFGVGANNDEEVFVTGGNSVLKQLDDAAKALAFPQQARELADRVIRAQPESVFVPGPQQERRVADM